MKTRAEAKAACSRCQRGFVGRSLCGELTRCGFVVRAAVRRSGAFDESWLSDCFSSVIPAHALVGDIGPDTNWQDAL